MTGGQRFNMLKPDDFLQPSDPRFKEVYGYDPIKDHKNKTVQKEQEKEQKKAGLEEKYWNMKKEGRIKPWQEKELHKIVLKEERY